MENDYTKEEMKMIWETRKILHHPDLKVTATTVRVPVFSCHSEAINVEFEKPVDPAEAKEVLKNAPGIIVRDASCKKNILWQLKRQGQTMFM